MKRVSSQKRIGRLSRFGCVLDDFESTLLNLEGDGIARVRKGGEVRLYGNMGDVT
jgi:hypothetical protein